jgi:hypothetical protein
MAPVFRKGTPNRMANSLATELLPLAAGPSMATIVATGPRDSEVITCSGNGFAPEILAQQATHMGQRFKQPIHIRPVVVDRKTQAQAVEAHIAQDATGFQALVKRFCLRLFETKKVPPISDFRPGHKTGTGQNTILRQASHDLAL